VTNDPTDWHQVLARVSGQLVRGEQRVSTRELFAKLGVQVTDRACRRLKRVMHDLGWRGPRLMRWGKKTLKGYWRHPTVSLPAIVQQEPVAEIERPGEEGSLAPELERVTLLGLQKLEQILRIPTDRGDGNLLRAQTAAAGLAVNVQMRVDEAKMRQVRGKDIMEEIIARIEEEKARMAERRKAAARTDIVDSPTCAGDAGIDIVPAQDAKDRA
jgi:hypothetical protein